MKHSQHDNAILLVIDSDLNYLAHHNTKGSHWYQHDPSKRYYPHAKYAMGKPDPDAKKGNNTGFVTGNPIVDKMNDRVGKAVDKAVDKVKTAVDDAKTKSMAKNDAKMWMIESNTGVHNTKAYRSIAGKSRASVAKKYNDYVNRGSGTLKNTKFSKRQKQVYEKTFDKYIYKYGEETKLNYGKLWNFSRDGLWTLKK